jgi:hypothetical protein
MLSDLQRWLIRSSAKTMRKEITGQVRKTLGGGRTDKGDVWDVATTEIPPDVGESPECQWCPICRAARRMRDSGPGLGGQLSGAGDAVASAVQDAIGALDSILGKAAGGGSARDAGSNRGGGSARADGAGRYRDGGARTSARPGSTAGDRDSGDASAAERPNGQRGEPGEMSPGASDDRDDVAGPHGSAAGDHGPGGWKPGDRLATAQTAEPDPWTEATDSQVQAADGPSGAEPGAQREGQADGPGYEPDDRR